VVLQCCREEKVANVEHEHDRSAEAPVSSVDTDNVKTKFVAIFIYVAL